MTQSVSARAEDLYSSGAYADKHEDWHLSHAPGKAQDIWPSLEAIADRTKSPTLKIADVGAGVGGVLHEAGRLLQERNPNLELELHAYDIAPVAIEAGRKQFPDLHFHCQFFDASEGHYDAVMLIDVLEHLENPWELLRTVHAASEHLIVRQPLIESLSTFRHRNYGVQRKHWGHIAYFNVHSFADMLEATGWVPVETRLVAPWELKTSTHKGSPHGRLLTRLSRNWASILLAGFYLNAAYRRA
jgi:hypothetical protein